MIWQIIGNKGKVLSVVHAPTEAKAMAAAKALLYKTPVLYCAEHAANMMVAADTEPFKGARHVAS